VPAGYKQQRTRSFLAAKSVIPAKRQRLAGIQSVVAPGIPRRGQAWVTLLRNSFVGSI
jgi:hypothetical protein